MLLNNLGTEVGLTNGTLGKLIAHIRIDSKTFISTSVINDDVEKVRGY